MGEHSADRQHLRNARERALRSGGSSSGRMVGVCRVTNGTRRWRAWGRGLRARYRSKCAAREMSVSRPHSAAFVAGHDAPLIGERAGAAQRKVAMSAPVRKGVIRSSFRLAYRSAGQRSTLERPTRTTRPATRRLVSTPGCSLRRPRCAAHRRTRRDAPGASQWNVATSAPV
jgi:hypothetical protein